MPIEIRELYIKAVVDAGSEMTSSDQIQPGQKTAESADASNPEQIIDLCVEKVLEILNEKKER